MMDLSLHARAGALAALAALAVSAPAGAGMWQITHSFAGSATGTYNPDPGTGYNKANGQSIGNGGGFSFAANTTSVTLTSGVANGTTRAETAHANTDGCVMTFTLTWIPDPGKDLTTDPPPAAVTVVVDLSHRQWLGGYTPLTGTMTASAALSGDNITFPTLQRSLTGWDVTLSVDTGVQHTKSIHANLGVPPNGVVTLQVPLSAETSASWTPGGGGGFAPSIIAGAKPNGNSSITPTASVRDAVLVVPDPKVFPRLNPPSDSHNRYCFSPSLPDGVLGNPPWEAQLIGTPAAPYLGYTTFTPFAIGAPTVRTNGDKTVSEPYINQQFTYTRLPNSNGEFGDKQVTFTVSAPDLSTAQTANVQIFFPKYTIGGGDYASNHPATAGFEPNWYYYWSQTSAYYGTNEYEDVVGTGVTYFVVGRGWVAHIRRVAALTTAAGTWNSAEGIDLFANICRHEEQHRLDMTALWGNADRMAAQDADGDVLPDAQEPKLVPYHPYNPTLLGTYPDTFNYGGDPEHLPDDEDYCLRREPAWTNGSADSQDWAFPGKQWYNGGQRY